MKLNEKTADMLAEKLVQVIKAVIDPLKAELADVKQKIGEMERNALKGGLPWQKGAKYAVSDCVQYDGSLWRCVEAHTSGATFSHEHFLLQIKRGRDGTDAR